MKYRLITTLILIILAVNVTEAQSFRDNNNMLLGKVESDGTIRDNNNMRIGTASGINTKYAAVLFFFELF